VKEGLGFTSCTSELSFLNIFVQDLSEMALIFFIEAGMVLCFRLSTKKMLITWTSGVVDMPKGTDAIQRDLGKLKKWVCVKLMRFSKATHRVLHMRRSAPTINTGWEMKG